MELSDDVLIESARMGGRSNLFLPEGNYLLGSLRGGGKTCLMEDLLYREWFGVSLWEKPKCTLMKTKSKQSRYVRVWRK